MEGEMLGVREPERVLGWVRDADWVGDRDTEGDTLGLPDALGVRDADREPE